MNLNFPKIEKRILKFWQKEKIFKKSIERRKKAKNFVFYEGPPTANAAPGIHHVLARVYKDIVLRYKTMQGFEVLRKAGWDTHGLPVELEIEKKLGLKNKKEIEKYGITKFNKKCKKSVWEYKKDWEKLTERIAFWLNLENPYITYTADYIETVWYILKQIYQKGLLYQDYKVVPYCSRCGTSLSSHEVALGYEKIKESAIYIKFKILNPEFKNSYLLVWTTTPWTLPGNVAIAANPNFIYAKIKIGEEYLILAKERLQPTPHPPAKAGPIGACGIKEEIAQEFRGKDLIDLRYEPLYPFDDETSKRAYKVIPAEFVSLEEGTGLVHIAPAFGEEDMVAGKENNLPILLNVNEEGKFTLDVKKWAGLFVKEADPLIIEDLKKRELLFKEEMYEHDYPFCWRCHSPLLYYAKQSWFINMQKVKKDLIKNNQKINWVPKHLKDGRFGEWLKEIKDWAITRERYWGTPLPVWKCKTCNNLEVIGSLKDLLSQKFSDNNYFIFRHGDSLRQTKKVAICWPEKIFCPLTKEGEKEVKTAAKKLKNKKIDIIFSSDLLRTKQTAEILSQETGAKIIFDKRLREYNVGIFNGKNSKLVWDYLNLKKGNIIFTKPPKGESLMKIGKRMYGFLKDANKKYLNKNILIVSHELPLTILEGVLKGWPIEKILEWRKWEKESRIKTGKFREVDFKDLPHNEKLEIYFHRPYVDEVKFFCSKCGGVMERVPEVIDCWFDSGSMPFGQAHWPFSQKNKKLVPYRTEGSGAGLRPPELFPADYISEAVDQTRGWFYTLLAISTLLGFGAPYKNVISLGHVLNEKGEKMSKSKGNVVNPWIILEKYGSDATRWYFYTVNQPGDPKLFSEKDIDQALKKFILTFWNSFVFYNTYAEQRGKKHKDISVNQRLDQRKSAVLLDSTPLTTRQGNILDRWIISRLNELIQQVTEKLDKYDVTGAARAIENFVVDDLSLWYIRRSRRRFHPALEQSSLRGKKTGKDYEEASQTLGFIILTLSKLTAPFIPFLSEEIYHCLRFYLKQSVHLEDWPKVNKKLIDKKLEKKMEKVREIVTRALAERAKAGIRVRQPLPELRITNYELRKEKELLALIQEEVNVKKITFGKTLKLDTEITPELRKEGEKREILRNVKDLRKELGLSPQYIVTGITSTASVVPIYMEEQEFKKEMGARKFIKVEKENEMTNVDAKKEIELGGKKHFIGIKKK